MALDYLQEADSNAEDQSTIIDMILSNPPDSSELRLFRVLLDVNKNWACFERWPGVPLALEDVDLLIKHLQNFRKQQIQRFIKESTKVFYPCNLPYINWTPETKRPASAKRYGGVYFAEHDGHVDQIKIGCSIDVYQRTNTLFHEYKQQPLTVIAFIESERCRQTETLIHSALEGFRKEGGWFDRLAALDWLKGLAS